MEQLDPDIVEHLTKHWESIAPDIKQHLADHYGFSVSKATTPTTTMATRQRIQHAPGLGTTGLEMVGGTLGQVGGAMTPIPGGRNIGGGVGTAIGGGIGDIMEGRPLTLGSAGERFATGALVPPGVEYGLGKVGQLGGALARPITSRLPSFAEFFEKTAPGVLRRGARALAAVPSRLAEKTPAEIGEPVKKALTNVISRFRTWSDAAFKNVADMTGTDAIIDMPNLQQAANELRLSGPMGTAPTEEYGRALRAIGLTPKDAAAFQVALRGRVSFQTARDLESALGKLAAKRRGSRIVGDAASYQYDTLSRAVTDDIDAFMSSPSERVQPGAREALDLAKRQYGEAKQFVNDHVNQWLEKNPEDVLSAGFSPGNVTESRVLRQALPPKMYDRLVDESLNRNLYQEATVRGQFDPTKYADQVELYRKTGHLKELVSPSRAAELLKLRDEFWAQAKGQPLGMVGRVAGRALPIALGVPVAGELMGREGYGQRFITPEHAAALGTLAAVLTPGGRAAMTPVVGQAASALTRRFLDQDIDLNTLQRGLQQVGP